jgi:hypothetical protein
MPQDKPEENRPKYDPATDEQDGIRSDSEIKEILEEVEEDRPLQLEFPNIDESEEEKDEERAVESVQNPKKAHRLYYKKKEPLLKQMLPEGGEYKEARSLIREQVNLYLKEGNETGRDGRSSYTLLMEDVVAELQECVEQNVPLVDVYRRIREMNKEAGHLDDETE